MGKSKSGFTIVELLIVIVVIAILATISIVAYNGIQQRASNTKTISAVSQVVKSISSYIATNDSYPYSSGANFCLVPSDSGACTTGGTTRSASTTLTNNLKTLSTLPTTVPDAQTNYNGIVYSYDPTRTYNGASNIQPVILLYSLRGDQQQCGVPNITNSGGLTMSSSSSGYTTSGGGYTICVVSIVGPNS